MGHAEPEQVESQSVATRAAGARGPGGSCAAHAAGTAQLQEDSNGAVVTGNAAGTAGTAGHTGAAGPTDPADAHVDPDVAGGGGAAAGTTGSAGSRGSVPAVPAGPAQAEEQGVCDSAGA
ncbi:hypothetical protein B1T50_26310, partial [Mycobacterium kansasii]